MSKAQDDIPGQNWAIYLWAQLSQSSDEVSFKPTIGLR